MLQTEENLRCRKAITAVHEAGHSVVALKLGRYVYGITVEHRREQSLMSIGDPLTEAERIEAIAINYAGRIAQRKVELTIPGEMRGQGGLPESDGSRIRAILEGNPNWRSELRRGRDLARAIVDAEIVSIKNLTRVVFHQGKVLDRQIIAIMNGDLSIVAET